MAIKAKPVSILVILALVAVSTAWGLPAFCGGGGNIISAEGGNISTVNMCLLSQTRHWQGYAGRVYYGTAPQTPAGVNATGGLVNGTNINFTIACDNPTYVSGYIAFSNSSNPPIGLVPGDLGILDTLSGNKTDSGSKTFTYVSNFDLPSGTINNVPTTFSYVTQDAQNISFREGYFNQGNDLVFVTIIENGALGYNSSFFDFQALLMAPNQTTVPYYLFADLNFSCPVPPGPPGQGGAGGYPGVCIMFWVCDPWGACQDDGFQYRQCRPRIECPNMTGRLRPPQVRQCQPREEMPEVIPENKIFMPGFIGNLSLNLTPGGGYILEPAVMNGTFRNNNYLSVEDVTYKVTTPKIYTAFANAHPAPMVLWNTAISGWKDHGHAEARALDWFVIPPEPLPRLNPRTTAPYYFTVIPPVMQPKIVDIGIDAYSGPSRVKSTIAPLTVEVHPFQVAAEWRMPGVVTLYFVVDNRGSKEKDINIGFDLNRGRSTLTAELLGPLRVPADTVAIYGHEYRLGKSAQKAEIIDARLISKDGTLRETYKLR